MFKAWTEPEQVAPVVEDPQGFTATFCDMDDVRPGGKFRFLACAPSPSGTTHWKRGVYREIMAPGRIVFTFAAGGRGGQQPGHELLTTVTLTEHGTQPRLTLHRALFKTVEGCDDHRRRLDLAAWNVFANYMTME